MPARTAAPPGDLYIVMNVQPHPFFERRGDDLYTVVPVTVPEASLGREGGGADDRWAVASAHSARNQQREKVASARERGASMRQPGKRGDQIMEVQVVVPKPEDERVRNLLKELGKLDPEDPRQEIFARATV